MVFSSQVFLFWFLPAALLLYFSVPGRFRHLTLTLVSYFFYGWANPWFVLLMLGTTIFDYAMGLVIAGGFRSGSTITLPPLPKGGPRTRGQRTAITLSVISNLSLLGFFKYFNFGVDNYNALVAHIGLASWRWDSFFRVVLPLGISFYTFQSMSYTIDVYRGDAPARRNFTDFSCYVSMFPHLVAGPIVRFRDLSDQLEHHEHSVEKFARGVSLVSLGLAKKVLLANACGKVADACFGAGSVTTADAWYGVTHYAFQIYFDFSGYSDMAIGLALMFGFVIKKNFDSPYRSASITEFWRRWHLSLSTWLRDYLYVPLGGNRLGERRTYVNLFLVMLLGGLWHGASWNFVIWGALHGSFLCAERWRGRGDRVFLMPRPLRVLLTFALVLPTWVFFRAHDLPSAFRYLKSMAGIGKAREAAGLLSGLIYQPGYVLAFAVAAVVVWACPQAWNFTRTLTWPKAALCLLLLALSIVALTTQSYNPFIYFIF
jgi:alginate O-acetyltransferase complex protein AlgI